MVKIHFRWGFFTKIFKILPRRNFNNDSSRMATNSKDISNENKEVHNLEKSLTVSLMQETLRKIKETNPDRIKMESENLKNEKEEKFYSCRSSLRKEVEGLRTELYELPTGSRVANEVRAAGFSTSRKRFYYTKAIARCLDLNILSPVNTTDESHNGLQFSSAEWGGVGSVDHGCESSDRNEALSVRLATSDIETNGGVSRVLTMNKVLGEGRSVYSPRDIQQLNN